MCNEKFAAATLSYRISVPERLFIQDFEWSERFFIRFGIFIDFHDSKFMRISRKIRSKKFKRSDRAKRIAKA